MRIYHRCQETTLFSFNHKGFTNIIWVHEPFCPQIVLGLMNTIKISVLCGSIRNGRLSHLLAKALTETLMKSGSEAILVDLIDYPLPLLEETFQTQTHPDDPLSQLQRILDESQAIILLSPEYHGSYTGVMKNALDYFQKEFYRKPMAVASCSTGKFGGINASIQMQHLILSLGAFPMPQKLIVPTIHHHIDEEGKWKAESLQLAIEKFAEEFIWFAESIHLASAKRKQKSK